MKRKLIAAILILILAASTISYGSGITASMATYPINLNGQRLEATLLNVNGSTYLPVRTVSEALGVDIGWTGSSVEIDTVDIEALKEACTMIIASDGDTYEQGSGVYIDYNQVLTAYHGVDEGRINVRTAVDKSDPNTMTVIASAPAIDVAVLEPVEQRKPVKIGDSDEVKAGDKVILISTPTGKVNTVSYGTVKGYPDKSKILIGAISADGSSGGAVFDMDGCLIGILIAGDVGLKECNIVPINTIKKAL
jgi:S1-C subfamily serine protease